NFRCMGPPNAGMPWRLESFQGLVARADSLRSLGSRDWIFGYAIAGLSLDGAFVCAHGEGILHSAEDDAANHLPCAAYFQAVARLNSGSGADIQCEDRRVHVDDEPFDFGARVLLDLLAQRGSHLVDRRG